MNKPRRPCNVYVVHHHFGEPVSFRFTVLVKTKVPKIQQVEGNRTESDLGRLGDIVRTVERAIAAEVFFPNETPPTARRARFANHVANGAGRPKYRR